MDETILVDVIAVFGLVMFWEFLIILDLSRARFPITLGRGPISRENQILLQISLALSVLSGIAASAFIEWAKDPSSFIFNGFLIIGGASLVIIYFILRESIRATPL